ncbi:MAG: peptidoglycan editing factor PgeF [Spirochaetes bacterium]|nr:peptidoglycan editing factor PgeF [Spirochaetota bacterium]
MVKHITLSIADEDLYTEIPFPYIPDCNIRGFVSLRNAGNMSISGSDTVRSRNRIYSALGINGDRVAFLHQVHSKKVLNADTVKDKPAGGITGDGLISGDRSIILSVTVADCLPVFLLDKRNCFFGLLHSGRRGTGIVLNAVKMMEKMLGSVKEDIAVLLGPGIGVCCYEVSEDLYLSFKNSYGGISAVKRNNKYFIDLREANINILKDTGIKDIGVIDDCTSCNKDLYSFRRDGKEKFRTMTALIGEISREDVEK